MTTITALPRRRSRPLHPFHKILLVNGVAVADAARALKVSRAWLSGCLNGRSNPGKELAARMGELAASLGTEIVVEGVDHARP